MLILTRRTGETIRIGDEVSMTVLDVHGNQVRIGFDAPKTTPIHREEIYKRIHDIVEGEPDAEADGNKPEPPPE